MAQTIYMHAVYRTMSYELHKQSLRERLRKFIAEQRAAGAQFVRWNAELALGEPTPRPHMRPVRTIVRESRTHYTPP
jgi:hypothetical protein